MTLIEQLNDVYYKEEWWQSHKETWCGITNYHQAMLDKGNLIVYVEDEKLLGYCEFWRINFEQFGRLVCHEDFIAPFEDTTSGKICYLANTWIDPLHRRTNVYKELRNRFFKLNYHCDYFTGETKRKRTQLISVFKRKDLRSKLFKKGEL